MPDANTAQLTSVYVRYRDTTVHPDKAEKFVLDNEKADLVLSLEAGRKIFLSGAAFTVSIVLNDLSSSSTTVFANVASGNLNTLAWPRQDYKYCWTLDPAAIPLVGNHVYQAIGVMSVAGTPSIVDAKLSQLFVVQKS